jgi:hypothetical protein
MQYVLQDDPPPHSWRCGLERSDGTHKASYDSYEVVIDVKRVDASTVEIFSLARNASGTPIVVATQSSAGGAWTDVDGIATDALGFGVKRFSSTGVFAWKTHYLGVESRVVGNP